MKKVWRRTKRLLQRMDLRLKRFMYYRLKIRRKRTLIWASRAAYGGMALLIMGGSLLLASFAPLFQKDHYELSENVLRLIGDVRDDAAEYLKPAEDQSAYHFVVPESVEGTSERTGRVVDAYDASFSVKPKGGISVTEKATQVPVRLVPQFYTGEGKEVDGRIIYPFGKNQLIYSLKYNGLKEDIIIAEPDKDDVSFRFELVLPVGAEARLESNGDIGIYTASSELFGNMTYGSDEDRQLVERARETSDKNNLTMIIPAPIIKDATGREYTDRSEFKLGEKKLRQEEVSATQDVPDEVRQKLQQKNSYNVYNLTLASNQLRELIYPIAIDPTFTIPGAADFGGVEFGAGISPDYSEGVIRRGELTGGSLSSWSSTSNLPSSQQGFGSVVHNGYVYLVGGEISGSGTTATVNYAKFNTNGSLAADAGCGSTWCATSSLNTGRRFHQTLIANGFIYAIGGTDSGGSGLTSVEFAKLKSDGTLGTWAVDATATASTFIMSGAAVYENYVYILGGSSGSTASYYAHFNADGSVAGDSGCGAAWCNATTLPATRIATSAVAYNGWVYMMGGRTGATSVTTQVHRAPVNIDGSLGSWTQATSLNTARFGHGGEVWNGYMYVTGGCPTAASSQCASYSNTVEYAPVHTDGSLGTWRTTDTFTTSRNFHGSAIWNGNLYILGGCTSGSCSSYSNTIYYAGIDAAGAVAAWATTTNISASLRYHTSFAYNGYVYVVGGLSGATHYTNVRYAPINAVGTVGTWANTSALNTGRSQHAATILNGYMYVTGGQISGGVRIDTVEYAPINSDGTVGTWNYTSALPVELRSHGLAGYNGWLYAVGGNKAGSSFNVVYRASLNSNGTLNAWSSAGSLATSYRSNITGSVFVYEQKLYVVGGCLQGCPSSGSENYSLYYQDIDYIEINSDGSLDEWETISAGLGTRSSYGVTPYNGYLYIVGGYNAAVPGEMIYDTVERAPFMSNGSIGTFTQTSTLTVERYAMQSVAWNGFLYSLGGTTSSSTTSNGVEYAAINNGGRAAASTFSAGTTFSTARKLHASVVHNGYLYVLGGCTTATVCTTATNTVRYAPLNADGSIGTWSNATTNFSTARRQQQAWVYGNRLYVAAGLDASGTLLTDIQYAAIDISGDIASGWTTDDTAWPGSGSGAGVALRDNVIYVVGGSSTTTTTRYAEINALTGDVGSFSTSTALPTGRYNAATTIYNGYIYVMGGSNSGAEGHHVYYAPLNSNNTIGTWRLSTAQLNIGLRFDVRQNAFAFNGYLYLVGGHDGTANYNYVQYAAIGPNGDVGAWQRSVATGLSAHGDFAAVQYKGTVYVTGGQYTSNNPTNANRYASLQVTPRMGSFKKAFDFEAGIRPGKLITRGTKASRGVIDLKVFHSVECGSSEIEGPRWDADLDLGASNALDLNSYTPYTLARCYQIVYSLDDQQSGVFPDAGRSTSISNFELQFTANPGSRLRGGRSFINGADRGLEAN